MTEPQAAPSEQAHELKFQIQIDRAHYEVHQEQMTGEQIRHVPPTPIGADRDL